MDKRKKPEQTLEPGYIGLAKLLAKQVVAEYVEEQQRKDDHEKSRNLRPIQ